jgi:hypothetical protein
MITSMISRILTYDLTYDITVNPHINTILQANDFNVSIPHCAGERSLAGAKSGKLRTEVWKSWMACALRPGLRMATSPLSR